MPLTLNELPSDVLERVIAHLDTRSLKNLVATSTKNINQHIFAAPQNLQVIERPVLTKQQVAALMNFLEASAENIEQLLVRINEWLQTEHGVKHLYDFIFHFGSKIQELYQSRSQNKELLSPALYAIFALTTRDVNNLDLNLFAENLKIIKKINENNSQKYPAIVNSLEVTWWFLTTLKQQRTFVPFKLPQQVLYWNLQGASLQRTNLERANLKEANLRVVNLRRAFLLRANLRGANLGGAYLGGAYLEGADLDGADLREANLWVADLRGASLQGASLQRTNLERANLKEANLKEANLERAYLDRADLEGADLGGAVLEGADLGGANLKRVNLEGANLEGANLERTDLEGADLEGADLKGADLGGTYLIETNLQNAIFSDSTNLENCNFAGANIEGVTWPSKFLPSAAFSTLQWLLRKIEETTDIQQLHSIYQQNTQPNNILDLPTPPPIKTEFFSSPQNLITKSRQSFTDTIVAKAKILLNDPNITSENVGEKLVGGNSTEVALDLPAPSRSLS